MTREELADILKTLPGVFVRWGTAKDLPGVLALEAATLGDWNELDFREFLMRRGHIILVAQCRKTGNIRGYALYAIDAPEVRQLLTVANMTAGDPVARAALIEGVRLKAAKYGRSVAWKHPTY